VALVLNPAELLRQARDSQRLSDLRTINSALGLWLASASSTTISTATTTCTGGNGGAAANFDGGACELNSSTTIAGAGWIYGINFTFIPGGSPLSKLPLDPTNSSTYHYEFSVTTSGTYELNANMESDKYESGGASDVESSAKDGGDNPDIYEIGTDPDLNLI
jgi:hypothetical protein